jgi:DNA-binding response OmpR family regulator
MSDKQHLLIVEDDLVMGMELREFLEEEYEVVSPIPSTGEEAVEAVRTKKPDLVLMDIKLKGDIDGIEASRRIRQFSDIPIIFLTGFKNESNVNRAAQISNSRFLTKPFDPELLLKTMQETLK